MMTAQTHKRATVWIVTVGSNDERLLRDCLLVDYRYRDPSWGDSFGGVADETAGQVADAGCSYC